jgi:hypothetical protein
MDIDALIRIEHLKEDERQDPKALQKTVLCLLYRKGGPPMMPNAGDPNDGVTREDYHADHIEGVVH